MKKSRKPKPSVRDSCSVGVTSELNSLNLHTETSSSDTNEAYAFDEEVTFSAPDVDEATTEPSSALSGTHQEQSIVSNGEFKDWFKLNLAVLLSLSRTLTFATFGKMSSSPQMHIFLYEFFYTPGNISGSPNSMPGNPQKPEQIASVSSSVNTLHLQGAKATQSRCFICQSKGGRKALPWPAIQQAWFEMRCYVPKTNRTCEEHLTDSHTFNDEALRLMKALKQDVSVEAKEFELWLHAISDLRKSTPYNFEHDGIEAEKYKMFLGIDKDNFDDMLQYLKGNSETLFYQSKMIH